VGACLIYDRSGPGVVVRERRYGKDGMGWDGMTFNLKDESGD
jgi:hypothetical protein